MKNEAIVSFEKSKCVREKNIDFEDDEIDKLPGKPVVVSQKEFAFFYEKKNTSKFFSRSSLSGLKKEDSTELGDQKHFTRLVDHICP